MPRRDSVRFLGDVPHLANLSDLTRPELEALLLELFGKVSSLEAKLGEQREEIARLKGLKGRPVIKPSGMDKGTEPPKPAGHVTWRKISAGTRSQAGRDCRDAFLSLGKTCDKLGIAAWDYLGSRLKVAGAAIIEPLDHYIRARQRPA